MRLAGVQYSPHFIRAFKKLPAELKRKAAQCERWFIDDCFDPRLETHKLSGKLTGVWAFSVTQKHRILFVFEHDVSATFIDVDDHDIYR